MPLIRRLIRVWRVGACHTVISGEVCRKLRRAPGPDLLIPIGIARRRESRATVFALPFIMRMADNKLPIAKLIWRERRWPTWNDSPLDDLKLLAWIKAGGDHWVSVSSSSRALPKPHMRAHPRCFFRLPLLDGLSPSSLSSSLERSSHATASRRRAYF